MSIASSHGWSVLWSGLLLQAFLAWMGLSDRFKERDGRGFDEESLALGGKGAVESLCH